MTERMYYVKNITTGAEHLRITTHPARALKHVITPEWEVTVPSGIKIAQLMASGVQPIRVEDHDVITE